MNLPRSSFKITKKKLSLIPHEKLSFPKKDIQEEKKLPAFINK